MRAILHVDKTWGIGKANTLMFSLPADMKFFRETTKGKIVVMGLNTLRSFPGGKPLKNRTNIVLCPEDVTEDVITMHSLDELLDKVKNYPADDVYVIGGASVYALLFPYCTEILVTKVEEEGGADTFVPNLDADARYVLISQSEPIVDNGHTIRFCTYKNLSPAQ